MSPATSQPGLITTDTCAHHLQHLSCFHQIWSAASIQPCPLFGLAARAGLVWGLPSDTSRTLGALYLRQRWPVHAASCFQCFDWPVQKHPWFRKGLPESLDVDAYNSHFVELSKAPDIIESREAIKRVMQVERRVLPGPLGTAPAC